MPACLTCGSRYVELLLERLGVDNSTEMYRKQTVQKVQKTDSSSLGSYVAIHRLQNLQYSLSGEVSCSKMFPVLNTNKGSLRSKISKARTSENSWDYVN